MKIVCFSLRGQGLNDIMYVFFRPAGKAETGTAGESDT